ncbi:MAG: AMP-binding protein [Siphonobacter sp.]
MLLIDSHLPLPHSGDSYEASALDFCNRWRAGQECFEIKTSGSTGTPKLIRLTRQQMKASAQLTGQTFGLTTGDVALCCLNVAYIAGMMMLVRTMELGLKTYVVPPSAFPLHSDLPKSIQFAAFVPLQLQTLLEHPEESLPYLNNMKAIIIGGAATTSSLEEALQVIQAPVYATYGMTETVSHIAVRRLNTGLKSDWFQALPGIKLALDERNCLNIKAAASNFDLVQTNDVVELTADRKFRILGRFDNIINSGGIKIQLETIEKQAEVILQQYAPGRRFFAWGFPDKRLGQRLGLVIEGLPFSDPEKQVILSELKGIFPSYEHPRDLYTIPIFRHTLTDKVDKRSTIYQLSTYQSDS